MTPDLVREWVGRYPHARSRLDAGRQRWHVIIPELRQELWLGATEIQAHRWGLIDEYSEAIWSLTEPPKQQQQGEPNDKETR